MKNQTLSWKMLFISIFGAGFTYAFFEWLFEVTRPSFTNVLSLGARIEIFLFTGSLLAAGGLVAAAPLAILSSLKGLRRWRDGLILLSALLPAGILACLVLLMVDNFTYTLFKFGIVSTAGIWRGAYALGFLVLIALIYRQVVRMLRQPPRWLSSARAQYMVLAGMSLVLVLMLWITWSKNIAENQVTALGEVAAGSKRPNIILLTSDGLDAQRMSVYGYERQTTPFLETMAPDMLIGENHFTNSPLTFGSVLAIYTGRYPVSTRAIYPPDILRGSDSYLHLPGILKRQGYRTVQISAPVNVDAFTMNLLDGFDVANNRTRILSSWLPQVERFLPEDFAYFLYGTGNRLADRLRHIFYLKTMLNPYELVTQPAPYYSDEQRLDEALNEIQDAQGPFFVHVHFMITHGPLFSPLQRVFSSELNQDVEWDVDGYDDAVLTFDGDISRVMEELKKFGLLENTILVIASDHGQNWSFNKRLPFLIRFPYGEYAGRIQVNTQNIDIAPTILDYMDIPIPDWMQGDSLLEGLFEQRPIVLAGADHIESGRIVQEKVKPPFYQFRYIQVTYCDQWYRFTISSPNWARGFVEQHTAPCTAEETPSGEQVLGWIVEHLETNGFDVSSLAEAEPFR